MSTIGELLERKYSGSCLESREYGRRDQSRWPTGTLYQQKVGTNIADKRRSLGLYSSLADSCHGVYLEYHIFSIANPEINCNKMKQCKE
jgi:hypothetical protein